MFGLEPNPTDPQSDMLPLHHHYHFVGEERIELSSHRL